MQFMGVADLQQPHRINLSEQVKLKVLKEARLFSSLSPDDIRSLSSLTTAFRLPKEAIIFKEGDSADFFYVVQEGFVRLYKSSSSGKMITFTIAGYGDTLNGLALSLDSYFMTAQTMSIANVVRIDKKEFLNFVETHPAFAMELIAIIARRTRTDYARTMDFVVEDVEQRLLYALYTLASKFGTKLFLTREELANFAGTTTETTIRVLSGLKKRGVLSCLGTRGEVVISSLNGLLELLRSLPQIN